MGYIVYFRQKGKLLLYDGHCVWVSFVGHWFHSGRNTDECVALFVFLNVLRLRWQSEAICYLLLPLILNELACDSVSRANEANIFLDSAGEEIFITVVFVIRRAVRITLSKFGEVTFMLMEISFSGIIRLNSKSVELSFCGSSYKFLSNLKSLMRMGEKEENGKTEHGKRVHIKLWKEIVYEAIRFQTYFLFF